MIFQVEVRMIDKCFIGYFESSNRKELIKYLPELYKRLEIENNSIKGVLIRKVDDYWYE